MRRGKDSEAVTRRQSKHRTRRAFALLAAGAVSCLVASACNSTLPATPSANPDTPAQSTLPSAVTASAGMAPSTASAGSNVAGASAGSASSATAGSGSAIAGSKAAAPSGAPTFARVWEEVLSRKGCSGAYCHGGGQGGLKFMSKDDAYKALVGAAAAGPMCASSGKQRVKPADPDASLLLDKISHTQPACGELMPIGAKLAPNCVSMSVTVCNTEAEITLVRDWIAAGAKND
jgi:hypothetical protein